MFKNAFIISILLLTTFSAQAKFFQADLKSTNSDASLGTHIIIAGKGMEVGDQWLSIAHTQALVFNDKTKHGPIRLISGIDNEATYMKKISTWGYQNIQVFNKDMTGSRVVDLISQNEKIASIDFIGHNGAFMGFALENYSNRFFLSQVDQLKNFKSKFTSNSFIRVMGCNTGWKLAPYMAEQLGVPASGTFTFSDIQTLFNNPATWYYNDEGRFPKGSQLLSQNGVSYSLPKTCQYGGGCMRLKAVSSSYQGKHGSYNATLPFAKYFCGSLDLNNCARRAAFSANTLISTTPTQEKPTYDQFTKIIADQMCSSWIDLSKRTACTTNVINHLTDKVKLPSTYITTSEKVLTCSFKKCEQQEAVINGNNVMQGKANAAPSTTFVDELNFYKLGFSLL